MPEDMSDRMPEDLPVTKCINLMVGITRSKVISFYMYMSLECVKFTGKYTRHCLSPCVKNIGEVSWPQLSCLAAISQSQLECIAGFEFHQAEQESRFSTQFGAHGDRVGCSGQTLPDCMGPLGVSQKWIAEHDRNLRVIPSAEYWTSPETPLRWCLIFGGQDYWGHQSCPFQALNSSSFKSKPSIGAQGGTTWSGG